MRNRIPVRSGAAMAILTLMLVALAVPSALAAQETDGRSEPGQPALQRALESRTRGSDSATVVVFEIADFQCPYCATFSESVGPALHDRYVATGQVQWVFVNLPLHTHPLAWHAAEAALCAGVAGDRFWEMHDKLFAEQSSWGSDPDPAARFVEYATGLGVPAAPFEQCVADDEVAALILQDLGSVVSAGISGTPTFIIMKDDQVVQRLVGVQPVEEWAKILDGALGR